MIPIAGPFAVRPGVGALSYPGPAPHRLTGDPNSLSVRW